MCGRYTLYPEEQQLAEEFEIAGTIQLTPRYNIAPTQLSPVVRMEDDGGPRSLSLLRWGLIPHWAKDAGFGLRTINARSETVHESPAFRAAYRRRRCLVPCSGFYEWKALAGDTKKPKKQPYFIRRADDRVFGLAGLWESWTSPEGDEVMTYTILTTTPNKLLADLHNRMPVIVAHKDYDRWLDPGIEEDARLRPLLVPYPRDELMAFTVSTMVNRPTVDEPGCIVPLSGRG